MQFLSILIMALVLTMIYISLILLAGLGWGRKAVRNSLGVPMDTCGVVDLSSNVDFEVLASFMEQACELEEVQAFGAYGCYGLSGLIAEGNTDYWGRMLEISNSGEKEFADEDSSVVQEVSMNKELFEMENIRLLEGDTDGYQKNECLIYLGYNFREIPVGTKFTSNTSSVRYVVAGIMEQGSRITDPDVLTINNDGLTLSYDVKLDNMILTLLPEGELYTVRNLFCAADGYTYKEAATALKKLGHKMGISMRTCPLMARLDTVFTQNDIIRSRINGIVSISCILLFMLCTTIQLLNTYTKRWELGVWLANGVSRREMFEILWLENFIKVVTGVLVAVAFIRFLLAMLSYAFHDVYHKDLREVVSLMYGMPLIGLLCAALLLVCAVSSIPVIATAKQQTAELVKGVWN